MGFGEPDGKMYYKIQKDISKKYSGTGPSVIVTLGPTPYSKSLVQCSGAWACVVPHIWILYFKINYSIFALLPYLIHHYHDGPPVALLGLLELLHYLIDCVPSLSSQAQSA